MDRVIEELDEDALPSNPGTIPGAVSTPVGVEDITLWLAGAKPMERLNYFVGNLMQARYYSPELDEIGAFAWNLQRDGRVRLFQMKVTDFEKIYLMQKLSTRH